MQDYYKDAYRQAEKLHHRFRDTVDEPDAPAMQKLHHETRQIAEDMEMDKKPRSIEDRIKVVQQELRRVRAQSDILMDYNDIDSLFDGYEDLRSALRKLPNY